MLEIFNNLEPFFEDTFREISVREYSRMKKISAPTASSLLKSLHKEGLLLMREERNLLLFRANRESYLFKDLAAAYWRKKLSYVMEEIHKSLLFPRMILFGSISKAENTISSDVDIYVEKAHQEIDKGEIEKKLKRKVQFHFKETLRNKHLKKNIKEGIIIK